jgi:Fic-DOC domain mobile mystery protein B
MAGRRPTSGPRATIDLSGDRLSFLIPRHISTQGELDDLEHSVIEQAQAWLNNSDQKEMTLSFVCGLHQHMFAGVWSDAGRFRRLETNIGVDPLQIQFKIAQLTQNLNQQIDAVSPRPSDELAVWFHHQLTQIHPFADGNGRHARMITDYLLRRVLRTEPFTWGSGTDLRADGPGRDCYVQALRVADATRDYSPLLAFVRS